MTRNDVKALFPEATNEQVKSLLDINSADIGKALDKGTATQEQLEAQITRLNDQIKTMTGQATDLNNQITALTNDVKQRDNTIKTLTDEKDTALNDLKAQHEVDVKTLKDNQANELKALQDQLNAAQEKATLADTLTDKVARLTSDVAERDATIRNNSKNFHIQEELRNMKARDISVIMPLLKVDDITEEDGKLNGLSEQVDALKEHYAYLFDSNPGSQRGGFSGNPDMGGNKSVNDAVNQAIRTLSGRN